MNTGTKRLAELMERFANVKTLHGQRAVVRNGYLPELEVLTAAGPIAVKVPKVSFVKKRQGSESLQQPLSPGSIK